jgi:HK97 gp10 family phage protein
MTVNWNSGPIVAELRQAAMRGVVAGTEEVRNEMVSLIMNGQKTGRLYWRAGLSKMSKSGKSFSGGHRASAPGEAPASDTGRLVNSITTNYDLANLVGTVTARTAYAAALEYGTVKMAPRPYARPAVASTKGEIEDGIRREIEAVLRGRGGV